MGSDKENLLPCREDLVAQLLEERRQRLQLKLQGLEKAEMGQEVNTLQGKSGYSAGGRLQQQGGDEGGSWRPPLQEVKAAWGIQDPVASPFCAQQHAPSLADGGGSTTPRNMPFLLKERGCWTEAPSTPSSSGVLTRPQSAPLRGLRGEESVNGSYASSNSRLGWMPASASTAAPQAAAPPRGFSESPGASSSSAKPRPEPGPEPAPRSARRNFGARQREWSQRQQTLLEKQQRARQEKEEQEMQHCTFKPAISSKSQFYARRVRGCSAEPLVDRLYHEADRRTTLREKAKELVEVDEIASHTFCPSVNQQQPSKLANHTPIHLRVDLIQRRKQEHVRAAQQEEERQLQKAFQPQISIQSRKLVQRKQRKELQRSLSEGQLGLHRANVEEVFCPVEQRLYREGQEMLERRRLQAACEESCSDAVSLGPHVDEGSRRICRSSVYFQGAQQDFLTRQKTFEVARQKRREIRSQHANSKCSFTPSILVSSRQLVTNNLDFLRNTPRETTERLAVKDVGRRGQRQSDLQAMQQGDCSFKPAVNPTSEQLLAAVAAASGGGDGLRVHERLYRSASESKSKAPADPGGKDECTFRPQMSPETARRFAHIKGRYNGPGSAVTENVRYDLERRSEALAEKRREVHEQRMEECTFAPGVGAPFEDRCSPVPVSGLDRFFELRSLALQQREEQRVREEKTWRPDLSDVRCLGVTIPTPFELSGSA